MITDHPRGRLSPLVHACHPGPTVAVTVLSTALAWSFGHSVAGCGLVGVAVLTGQLSIGWSNDAVDARRDVSADRVDKPVVTGAVTSRTLGVASGVALVACVALSLANGIAAGVVHLVGVAAGWAYNLVLKSTLVSWLPYAVAFGLLPVFVSLASPGGPWPDWWVVVAGALLGTGAHVANVLPDLTDDEMLGVRGLPHRLGARISRVLAPGLLALAALVLVFFPGGAVGWFGWVMAGLAIGLVLVAIAVPLMSRPQAPARYDRFGLAASVGIAVLGVALLLQRGALAG